MLRIASLALVLTLTTSSVLAQGSCPEEPPVLNGVSGQLTCPCFVAGEEAGAVFDVPAAHYPIEILRVGIGWGSQFGSNPQSLEQAIHVYPAALPNPGTPIFSLDAPVMTDGFINEFDLEPLPGDVIVNGGPFAVTLEFANDSSILGPSMVHDGQGCTVGANVIKAIPGGWSDGCALGITGDWQFQIVYRRTNCTGNGTYCVASINSTGQGGVMGFSGSTSVSANDLGIFAQQLPSNVFGLFYYGPQQTNQPFGDGVRCVGGQVFRIQPTLQTDFFGNVILPIDNTQQPFASGPGAFTPGSNWNIQYWHRDTAAMMSGFNLTNGLTLFFTP